MRLLVVGAGSTGGYVGGRLAEKGRDVTFLVRPARAAQLSEQGLRITSPHGNVTLQPKLLTAGQITAPFDAVLLTVKGFQLESAMADIAPAIGPETMILPFLNGMRHMEVLSRRFTPHNVPGCVLKIMTVLEDDGRIVQLTPMIDLAYGELDGTTTPRMRQLDEFMQGANVGARLSPNIHREMWEKWVLLASLGAITCLMRGTIGEIEAVPGGAEFALQVLDEVVAIVKAEGRAPVRSVPARNARTDHRERIASSAIDVSRPGARSPGRGREHHRRPCSPWHESGHRGSADVGGPCQSFDLSEASVAVSAMTDVTTHYDRHGLRDRIDAALVAAGLAGKTLTATDLAPLDQFHSRGLAATVELASSSGDYV